jgi:hypothetical protein
VRRSYRELSLRRVASLGRISVSLRAWLALLLADLAVIAARAWGTLTIYVHSISNGIIPELWLPSAVLALAVLLSWLDFFSPKPATR